MSILNKVSREISLNWPGYVVATASVALATWLKYLAQPSIIPADVPILYLLALVPVAIFFGLGPSVLMSILSLLAYDYYFVPPTHEFTIVHYQGAPILVIFFLVALAMSYLASNLRQKNRIAAQEILARKQSEAELARYRDNLEDLVKQRTAALEEANQNLNEEIKVRKEAERELEQRKLELESTNKELEAFSYSVAHDLRSPLRSLDGFSKIMLEDYAGQLDSAGKAHLETIRSSSQLMAKLIDDILTLSKVTRCSLRFEEVDLSALAEEVVGELNGTSPDSQLGVKITPGLKASGDRLLLKLVLDNLLSNAIKFTGKCAQPSIEFGAHHDQGPPVYFVRDNGVGFDMQYVHKLFKPFQRLHSGDDYPGTGIGLASVQRSIERHGGRIWAESHPGSSTTFYFTLERQS